VFALTFAVCAVSLTTHRQLGYLRGMADRWLGLGLNLRVHGVLGDRQEPTIFKPPGYPAFIALVLVARGEKPQPAAEYTSYPPWSELHGLPLPYDPSDVARVVSAVYWAQALALAAAAALMFLWLARVAREPVAFVGALLFGLSPHTLILVGFLHYSVLHLLLMIGGALALEHALSGPPPSRRRLFVAGLVWGLATLVRPVTLLLPPFVLAALLPRRTRAWREALAATLTFTLGMAVVLAPYTARNYARSGRLVPVSAQVWMNLWAASLAEVPPQPDHIRWKAVRDPLMRILKRVPESPLRTDPETVRDSLLLEAEFRRLTIRNLSRRPGVYAANVASSLWTLVRDVPTVLVKNFQYMGRPEATVRDWYSLGRSQDFHPPGASLVSAAVVHVLGLFSVAALLVDLRRRDPSLLVAGTLWLCVVVAHALVWMDLLYYYVKLPFVFVCGFRFVDMALGWLGRRAGAAWETVVLVLLLAIGVSLAAWIL
jgi:Glycosyltransferase family 87